MGYLWRVSTLSVLVYGCILLGVLPSVTARFGQVPVNQHRVLSQPSSQMFFQQVQHRWREYRRTHPNPNPKAEAATVAATVGSDNNGFGRDANYTYQGYNVTMRDGITLYVGVFIPVSVKPPAAVIYEQTPYGGPLIDFMIFEWQLMVNASGAPTIFVLQDVRGRENSTGTFSMMHTTKNDAVDTIEWILKQQWSNGNIFTMGDSAMALTSYLTLTIDGDLLNNNVLGVSALIGTPDLRQTIFEHGAFRTGVTHLMANSFNQTSSIPILTDHETPTNWWNNLNVWSSDPFNKIEFPMVTGAGWLDTFLEPGVEFFQSLSEHGKSTLYRSHRFIIQPNGHCTHTDIQVGFNMTAADVLMLQYYMLVGAYHKLFAAATTPLLFGIALAEWNLFVNTIQPVPRMIWYVWSGNNVGDGPGHYISYGDHFPTPKLTNYYLAENNLLVPDIHTRQTSYSYIYNPEHPVPSLGGDSFGRADNTTPPDVRPWCTPCGPWDQLLLGKREDILRFTTPEPLSEHTAITGHIDAHLFVSSNCTDTDFMVKLVDVLPNNTRLEVQEGVVRMRWRDGLSVRQHMLPGEVYDVSISLRLQSWIFHQGHRIGVDISSSNYPRFSANPNTGALLNQTVARKEVAHNHIIIGPDHPSRLTLPIVPLSSLPQWEP